LDKLEEPSDCLGLSRGTQLGDRLGMVHPITTRASSASALSELNHVGDVQRQRVSSRCTQGSQSSRFAAAGCSNHCRPYRPAGGASGHIQPRPGGKYFRLKRRASHFRLQAAAVGQLNCWKLFWRSLLPAAANRCKRAGSCCRGASAAGRVRTDLCPGRPRMPPGKSCRRIRVTITANACLLQEPSVDRLHTQGGWS
jgi:hypothetical protein